MLMFRKLLGMKVIDREGEVVGKLIDFVVTREQTPEVKSIIVLKNRKTTKIKWCVKSINEEIKLKKKKKNIDSEIIDSSDLLLKKIFLKRAVIILDTKKNVKLTDIGLSKRDNKLVIIEGFYKKSFFGREEEYVEWDKILPLTENIQLKESLKLERIQNADLAEIISSLRKRELKILLKILRGERAANAISRLDNKNLKKCVEVMTEKTLLEFLNLLNASKAAKVLRNISEKKRKELLSKIEVKKVRDVNELLNYNRNEIGSLMNLKPISFNENRTAGEIINRLREQRPDERNPYYLYVIDKNKRIIGVLTVRKLLVSKENKKAKDIMLRDIIKLNPRENIREARRIFRKYRFSALPVVNSKEELKGVITIKDLFNR